MSIYSLPSNATPAAICLHMSVHSEIHLPGRDNLIALGMTNPTETASGLMKRDTSQGSGRDGNYKQEDGTF